jgi:hypothetical protein
MEADATVISCSAWAYLQFATNSGAEVRDRSGIVRKLAIDQMDVSATDTAAVDL